MKTFVQGRSLIYITLLVLGTLWTGCDAMGPNSNPQNSGNTSFSARVSGLPGQATRQLSGVPKMKGTQGGEYLGAAFSGVYITLEAEDENGKPEYIDLLYTGNEQPAVGIYQIGGFPEDSTAVLPDFLADYVQFVGDEYRIYPAEAGSITLTVSNKEKMEGTFSFTSSMYYTWTEEDEENTGSDDVLNVSADDSGEHMLNESITVEGSFEAEVVEEIWACIEPSGPALDDPLCGDINGNFDGDFDDVLIDDPIDEKSFDEERFGSPYFILEKASGALGAVDDPALDNDTVVAWVYPSCEGGSFEVRYEVANNEARIRLFHANDGDIETCEASADLQKISATVPAEALNQARIVLLNPDPYLNAFEDGFVLR